ncbi:MAG: hypothetical protein KA956_01210 [Pyrinomonadaceae bacterium]|nr:hypothetical protein [Acidobacteriota bacterium]MBK7932674.1 hypothetical protein [Acidobacteriota bacterium]MBP7375073.1 hypothetical protein [Pyrinomonadaceae bacterium]
MASISSLIKVHKVIDDLFFEHQKALLHFDFDKALHLLEAHRSTLLSHMGDEEEILLPAYAERGEFPDAGAPKLYFDDHEKMRSFIDLFAETTARLASEPEIERTLLQLLDREAFYLRLCSHHDRRETDYLYPILESVLSEPDKVGLLDRVALRGEKHQKR